MHIYNEQPPSLGLSQGNTQFKEVESKTFLFVLFEVTVSNVR